MNTVLRGPTAILLTVFGVAVGTMAVDVGEATGQSAPQPTTGPQRVLSYGLHGPLQATPSFIDRLGLLLKAVADPGLDDGTAARTRVSDARLIVSGALDGGFDYMLQTNFANAPALLDARVRWTASPRFAVAAGRFKTPFSQELLTFGGALDFVSRSRVASRLAPNRQMGVQISGALDDHVRWAAGGFTGGTNSPTGEPLAGVFRVEGVGIEVGEGTLSTAGHVAIGRDGAIGAGALGSAFPGDGVLVGIDGRFESGRLLLAGELIRGDWDPDAGPETDAQGLYLTGGWMVRSNQQGLVRWDRYRAPSGSDDDLLLLGYNVWPTDASTVQVNWVVPLGGSGEPYRLLVAFLIGL